MLFNGSVRDVCMSHQSDWSYCKQPTKLPLVKVNRVWRFYPDFRTGIFVLLQTETGIILTFPMLRLLWLSPGLCGSVSKEPKNHSLEYTNMSSRLCPGKFRMKLVSVTWWISRTGTIVFSAKCTIGIVRGFSSVMVFARLPSILFAWRAVHEKELSPNHLCLRKIF